VITRLGHCECTDWGLPKGIVWDILKVSIGHQVKTGRSTCELHYLGHRKKTQGVTIPHCGLVHWRKFVMVNFESSEHCNCNSLVCKMKKIIKMNLTSDALAPGLLHLGNI
jgi:hypothetical protein